MAPTASSASGRVHIVLIPGFAGFDALGRIQYYAGVTPLFREWQAGSGNRVDLRYFDNLPTAGVVTRASRLIAHLAKRVARGEFLKGDAIAVVGHSTGGLDIRRMLVDLEQLAAAGGQIAVDGCAVPPRQLLEMVSRVAFLSVPQWGTNLADWARAYPTPRKALVAEAQAAVSLARVSPVDRVEAWLADKAAKWAGAELFLAVKDALTEMDANAVSPDDPRRQEKRAAAYEAASELALYLNYMAADFHVIDDLAVIPPDAPTSPAQFDTDMRSREQAIWREHRIDTRSYATLGRCPFVFTPGATAPSLDLRDPRTWPTANLDPEAATGTDVTYRFAYRACAGGPFQHPPGVPATATLMDTRQPHRVELWDNDGVVNTASALWPNGEETLLVRGDHGDIIGHYRLTPARPGSGREYDSYDVLRSGSCFEEAFRAVWRDVFDFCAS